VVMSRAQLALVVVGVNANEKDDFLRVKPEVALIVETHTSKWRIKAAAVSGVKRLADFAYGSSICTERSAEADYVECTESGGRRQIVAAIDGTVLIVGNSRQAVESCLQVRWGQRPSLNTDPELTRSRKDLKAESSLAFGYVSQNNAAKLFSLGAPLLLGKAPGDGQLERLLSESAGKILRNIAWTSTVASGRIEDRYQISLDPAVVKRLEPAFEIAKAPEEFWNLVPDSFRSVTIYRNKDPQAAWSALDSAVAIKLDAVSSVIFASLLRSGLSGFGVDNPKDLIAYLKPALVTIRPALGEGSLLLARVGNMEQFRQVLAKELTKEGKGQIIEGMKTEPVSEKEFTAVFLEGFVVLGKTENVKVYLTQLRNQETVTQEHLQSLLLTNRSDAAAVVTYSNDRLGLVNLVGTLALLKGKTLSEKELDDIQNRLQSINVSSTESSLNATGIERRTRSAFGQFGNLISLAQADSSNAPSR